ncbi:hypothetical protein TRFO_06718 [Tritrichomonas foetus]|uniref:Uncharacterized protein n=1 Tax=Tritrichomonas foetus TaxID=1144522 RepID=A0A1J4K134_9EUKA|nr:hypothetical protein TRFO_06718 [Tritrichomonas foetus]|eukprot:OHT03462.1 hypothetical protein TRFO_06718 [Tritrichomonas foetus]
MSLIDDFIRTCWNKRISANEFIDEMHSRYDNDGIAKITRQLMILCGQSYEPTSFIFDYFISIVQNNPSYIFSVIDESDPQQILGCVRLFIKCGDTLFNDFKIGTKDSAICALNALRLVLNYHYNDPNLLKEAIIKLSRSPMFSILITSGRVFAPDDFRQVREQFEAANPFDGMMKQLPVSQAHLLSALFTEELSHPQIIQNRHDIITLFASSVQIWYVKDGLFTFFIPDIMKHLYFLLITNFITNPSLQLAYMITNLFVRIILKKPGEDEAYLLEPFDKDNLLTLLDQLYSEFRPEKKASRSQYAEFCAPKIEKEYSDYFPKGLTLERVKKLLVSPPDYIDNSNIFATVFQYPMFVSQLPDYIISYLTPEHMLEATKFAEQIFKKHADFRLLITMQGKMTEFLEALAKLCQKVYDTHCFISIWTVMLSLYRYCWRSGSKIVRKPCIKFQEEAELPLSQFLGLLSGRTTPEEFVQVNPNMTLDQFLQISSPYEQCFAFLRYLILTNDLESVKFVLEARPYLWPSALLWGIKMRHKNAFLLAKMKMPNYKLIDTLFYYMMTALAKPKDAWLAVIDFSDYDLLMEFRPHSIAEIQYRIIGDLNIIGKISPLDPKKVRSIVISWRAWVHVFSLELFVKTLIDLLMWNTQSNSDPLSSKQIFQSAACFLVVVCDEDPEKILAIIKTAMNMLEEGPESVSDGDGLAQFCVILVIALHHRWKEAFIQLLDIRKRILNDESQTGSARMVFALSLIKTSLYISHLQTLISPDMFDTMFLKHDCQTAIDFFIAKEIAIKQGEIDFDDSSFT